MFLVFSCIFNKSQNLLKVLFILNSRLINPVVVAPTIAAVGISFYSYGFPQVGKCLEIGAVQILLVIIFSLVSSLKLALFLFLFVISVFGSNSHALFSMHYY